MPYQQLEWTLVEVFTPWKWTDAKNRSSLPAPLLIEPDEKHLSAHY